MDAQLRHSYDTCRRIHRRHDPTYYLATRRLPREIRPGVHALYGFVRGADELVDGPRRAPDPATRRAQLDGWERTLHDGLASRRCSHPVIAALVDAGGRHDLPLEHLRLYMRSMRIDCDPVRIGTWAELERYMEGSAGSVGRIMAALLGAPAGEGEHFARLGGAFQLTNFIRDVRRDYLLDRLYLPLEDRERFGVVEGEIARGELTPGVRALLALQVERARGLFEETAPAVSSVAPSIRTGMQLARAAYMRVLDRIEAHGFDVFRRRTGVGPWQLGCAAVAALRAGP